MPISILIHLYLISRIKPNRKKKICNRKLTLNWSQGLHPLESSGRQVVASADLLLAPLTEACVFGDEPKKLFAGDGFSYWTFASRIADA